jgi:hypothetical protein
MAEWPRTVLQLATPADVAAGSGGVYTSRYNLTSGGDGILTLPGIKGFDAPAYTLTYDELPALDGGQARHVRATARDVFLPLYLEGPDRPGALALKRGLLASISPTLGACRLTVTEGDGSARYLDAYYVSGAEGDEGQEISGTTWFKYGLQMRALDPYWYSGGSITRTFGSSGDTPVPFFESPFLGLHINRSNALNQATTLTVSGDVDTWPEWRIVGPADGVEFTRVGPTGDTASFSLDYTLGNGDIVYIDTRPGRKQVTNLGSGENLWDRLGVNPNLWAIQPGANTVTLDVQGTQATTSVQLTYRPRFTSA